MNALTASPARSSPHFPLEQDQRDERESEEEVFDRDTPRDPNAARGGFAIAHDRRGIVS